MFFFVIKEYLSPLLGVRRKPFLQLSPQALGGDGLKTPINGSKLVLNLSPLFSKVCCFNFLYQAGLPSINVWLITCYTNLTSTYHPY